MIACLEFSHTITDAFHKPSTVRHGDTAIGYTIGRAHNSVVMEIERTCMKSYPDRSGPGAPGSGSSTRSIRSRPPGALTMMAFRLVSNSNAYGERP